MGIASISTISQGFGFKRIEKAKPKPETPLFRSTVEYLYSLSKANWQLVMDKPKALSPAESDLICVTDRSSWTKDSKGQLVRQLHLKDGSVAASRDDIQPSWRWYRLEDYEKMTNARSSNTVIFRASLYPPGKTFPVHHEIQIHPDYPWVEFKLLVTSDPNKNTRPRIIGGVETSLKEHDPDTFQASDYSDPKQAPAFVSDVNNQFIAVADGGMAVADSKKERPFEAATNLPIPKILTGGRPIHLYGDYDSIKGGFIDRFLQGLQKNPSRSLIFDFIERAFTLGRETQV